MVADMACVYFRDPGYGGCRGNIVTGGGMFQFTSSLVSQISQTGKITWSDH